MAAAAFALGGSDAVRSHTPVANGSLIYMGITVRETGGATAVVRIRAGTSTGVILDTISLAANDSVTTWYGPQGKMCNGGLFEDFVSGAYEGSVFIA
jgi:hypothetical protein